MYTARAYRLNEIRAKYPAFITEILIEREQEHDSWQIRVMHPFHPDWWRELTSPMYRGMRWAQVRWLLTLVTVHHWTHVPVEVGG